MSHHPLAARSFVSTNDFVVLQSGTDGRVALARHTIPDCDSKFSSTSRLFTEPPGKKVRDQRTTMSVAPRRAGAGRDHSSEVGKSES